MILEGIIQSLGRRTKSGIDRQARDAHQEHPDAYANNCCSLHMLKYSQ
jgi:hypothetical protein